MIVDNRTISFHLTLIRQTPKSTLRQVFLFRLIIDAFSNLLLLRASKMPIRSKGWAGPRLGRPCCSSYLPWFNSPFVTCKFPFLSPPLPCAVSCVYCLRHSGQEPPRVSCIRVPPSMDQSRLFLGGIESFA
jgi:hypothetical protein